MHLELINLYFHIKEQCYLRFQCLRLGNNAGENTSAGMIVNLLSNDMRQFDDIIMFINYSWSGIASTIIILVLLSHLIGVYSAVGGFLAVLVAMPVQSK